MIHSIGGYVFVQTEPFFEKWGFRITTQQTTGINQEEEDDEKWEQEEDFNSRVEAMERTDWFPADVNPVRDGRYEVDRKEWPFPHWATFENGEWEHEELIEDDRVTRWRGTTEDSLIDFESEE